jgi:hypothetical protein
VHFEAVETSFQCTKSWSNVLAKQTKPETTPQQIPQIPRTLATSRDCRREMVALYKQAKRLQIDPVLVGRLTHLLNSIVSVDTGVGLDARLRALEERLDVIKLNGHARLELRP